MYELIPVNYENESITISARELHTFLEVNTRYNDWIKRMLEYGFEEGQDFTLVSQKRVTNNPKNPNTELFDYLLTIEAAKEISMIQRNEKGKMARKYFIEIEKRWNDPTL